MSENFSSHPSHSKYKEQRIRIRDVLEGSDAVKEKKTLYLPKLSGQEDDEYKAYITRATFFNITSRVYGANVGMITRRSPITSFPTEMVEYDNNASNFMSFYELFNEVVKELLAIGNCGIMVDIKNDRPIPVLFTSEAIDDWLIDENGDTIKVELLEQRIDANGKDLVVRYVLYLDIEDEGKYKVKIYHNDKFEKEITPTLKGVGLDFIPFIPGNYKGISFEILKSPILDIVDMNLSHYRTSADYEHALHFVSIPTPVFIGSKIEGSVKLGCAEGINLPDKGSDAKYLEFQGQGIEAVAKALDKKQAQISLFSARLQDTSTKGSEAENTVKLRYSADSASLSSIAFATEIILGETYKVIAFWIKSDKPKIDVNKDFVSTRMSSAELKELAEAFVKGAMDEETYIYNLERGEMLRPGYTPVLKKPVDKESTDTQE